MENGLNNGPEKLSLSNMAMPSKNQANTGDGHMPTTILTILNVGTTLMEAIWTM